MLLDSNIIIYCASPEHEALREFVDANGSAASMISKIEVLGYHRLDDQERRYFEAFFVGLELLPVADEICEIAISLRSDHNMKLGDALIAATSLLHELPLVTRNTDDFQRIEGLKLINPFAV